MTDRRTVILGLAAASLATPGLAATPYKQLFDGKTLDGWTPVGEAKWAVVDGAAVSETGAGVLLSKDSYRDFELRVELWVSPEANSGVFIRCSDRAQVTQNNSYEVNIFDQRPDPTYGTGGIVDIAPVAAPAPKAGGRWNVLEIVAKGDALSVTLNGQKTVDAVRDTKYAEGPIALQHGSGVVKFRKVEIRTL